MQGKINLDDKILILGARGNLGSQLARFLGNNYRLLLWDREDIDVLNFGKLEEKIVEHKPNIIINCVAYNAVDLCEEDDKEYEKALQLNRDLPAKLADISLETGARLVHFASDYVFVGDKEEGYSEDDETGTVSRYGESKLLGENEVLKRKDKGLDFYLIRTSKLFGPRGSSESAKESFFDLILRLSEERKEFNMVHGEEVSCFTYTPDLAKAVRVLIDENKESGIYHIVNEGAASWYDGAREMFKILNISDVKLIPSKSEDHPRPAARPKFSVLQNTKLPKLRDWKEALQEYLGDK